MGIPIDLRAVQIRFSVGETAPQETGGMRYQTKAEWARARATQLEETACRVSGEARTTRSCSDSRTRRENARRLLSEASRFRIMAERFAAAGV